MAQATQNKVEEDVYDYLGADNVLARYQSDGNAGTKSTARQISYWKKQLP